MNIEMTLLLMNSAFAIFTVSLICYLASFQKTILLMIVVTVSFLASIQFSSQPDHNPVEIMAFVKFVLLLPFGLGAVIGYVNLPEVKQKQFLSWFNRYINFAVLGNIFVMIFSPDGGTYRGFVSRFVCFFLLIWLVQEMAKVRFQTTQINQNIFTFNSSPLSWIFCHSAYRIALLSLPTFDSCHFILLEPLSILVMVVLYQVNQKKSPLSYYFGLADTIVVTTLTVLIRYPIVPPFQMKGTLYVNLSEKEWDMIFLPIQLIVIGFAFISIYKNTIHFKDWSGNLILNHIKNTCQKYYTR